MGKAKDLWKRLFKLGVVKPVRPRRTLYDVIVDEQGLEVAKQYVEGGHDVSQRWAGGHSLTLATRHGDLEFVRYFVENAPDLDQANTLDGPYDILPEAVKRIGKSDDDALPESVAIFEYLLGKPELRSQYVEAFCACATHHQVTPAQALIAAGLGDEPTRGSMGEDITLSERLDGFDQTEFAALIRGEDVDLEAMKRKERKERRRGDPLAMIFGMLPSGGHEPELKGEAFTTKYNELIDQIRAGDWDAALGSRDPKENRSVLDFAAENGFVELARIVVEKGQIPDDEGHRAARSAATYGHLEVLQVLAEAGVAVEKTSKNKDSPLSEACRYGYPDIVRFLLERGASPNAGDSSGHSFTLDDLAGGPHRSEIIAALEAHR